MGLLSLAVALVVALPIVLADATHQFRLKQDKSASKCWVECHDAVTSSYTPPGLDFNSQTFIKQNCEDQGYVDLMQECLPQYCLSAPDAAYGIEYGQSWCDKAGVPVNISLPQSYVNQAAAYFQSPAYLSGSEQAIRVWGLGGVVLIVGTVGFVVH